MKGKSLVFEDPKGKFRIVIPDNWNYKQPGPDDDIYLSQFEIDEHSAFQISCREINERLKRVIEANNYRYHNFDLPNLSFYETYAPNVRMHSYIWMCPIEDHLITAMFIFNPLYAGRDLALTLMEIRMLIKGLAYKRNNGSFWVASTQRVHSDYYQIDAWTKSPDRFFKFMTSGDRSKSTHVAPLEVDAVQLYALLKMKIAEQPNGFYTLVSVGKPLDNIFWWDFILECDKGFIQIWRTPHIIEAMYEFDDGPFDVVEFLKQNILGHKKDIAKEIEKFEKHTVYINHYKSYKECVNSLWRRIRKIDLTIPKGLEQHATTREEMNAYQAKLKKFIRNSVTFHTLGKSLVLNAAFEIESFLNLVIRVGAKDELRFFSEVLDKFLRSDFGFRLKNLPYHVSILAAAVDLNHPAVKAAKDLMTLRNKYVHFEEDSAHNKIGEVLFDHEFPLHPLSGDRPGVETVKLLFHRPSPDTVTQAFVTANNFIAYLSSLFRPELKQSLLYILEQNPISFNESLGVYSSVYSKVSVDFFNPASKANSDEK